MKIFPSLYTVLHCINHQPNYRKVYDAKICSENAKMREQQKKKNNKKKEGKGKLFSSSYCCLVNSIFLVHPTIVKQQQWS